MDNQDAAYGLRRLAVEHPDWLQAVEASVATAEVVGDRFAGAWVLDRAKRSFGREYPHLRRLVSYGILEKVDSTRGGRRAYYRFRDRKAVERTLIEVRATVKPQRPRLSFIGAGASKEVPHDSARRAGDTAYEPRSWR